MLLLKKCNLQQLSNEILQKISSVTHLLAAAAAHLLDTRTRAL
jgi:hypothetical protein